MSEDMLVAQIKFLNQGIGKIMKNRLFTNIRDRMVDKSG